MKTFEERLLEAQKKLRTEHEANGIRVPEWYGEEPNKKEGGKND